MDTTDTLPTPSAPEEIKDSAELWPSSGPAKGLRISLPIAIAALAVVGLVGAAGGAALKKPAATSSVQAGATGPNRAGGNAAAGTGAAGANGTAGANGAAGANGVAGRFGGGVAGTVSKVDGNTVTVTARDGSTATVVVSSGTSVSKTVSGSLADLTAGTTIVVRGTTADGKTTAESITINPANGAGGFGGPPPPGAATPGTTTN